MRRIAYPFITLLILLFTGIGLFSITQLRHPSPSPTNPNQTESSKAEHDATDPKPIEQSSSTTSVASPLIALPIEDALNRVTKKPFGILINKKTSPVQPERFAGYHVGVDFETFPNEQDIDTPIYAICDGPLVLKKRATGYGGIAVQRCTINNERVTVIYGHLKLSSITVNVGNDLAQGAQIGILGKGYSTETDGERKHLHLGIHRGAGATILGYVQQPSQLIQWMDVLALLSQQKIDQ